MDVMADVGGCSWALLDDVVDVVVVVGVAVEMFNIMQVLNDHNSAMSASSM